MALAAGKLRHRIEIQRPNATQDPNTGERVNNWTHVAYVWAEMVPASASQFIAASAEQSQVSGRFVVRQRSDFDATMRALYRGLAFQLLGVMPDPESGLEYMTMPYAEGVRVA